MKYPFKVYQIENEGQFVWIADSTALKGCTGQGATVEEAVAELAENETVWLETAVEFGIDIPSVPVEVINIYSGKFTVRVAPYVHKEAVENAKKQDISLNQYINDAIVSQNSRLSAINHIVPEIKSAISDLKQLIFDTPSTKSKGSDMLTFVSFALPGEQYSLRSEG